MRCLAACLSTWRRHNSSLTLTWSELWIRMYSAQQCSALCGTHFHDNAPACLARFVAIWLEKAPPPSSKRVPKIPQASHVGRPDTAKTLPVDGGGKHVAWGEQHQPHLGVQVGRSRHGTAAAFARCVLTLCRAMQLEGQSVVTADEGRMVLWVEAWDDEGGSRDPELIGSGMVELVEAVTWAKANPLVVPVANKKVSRCHSCGGGTWLTATMVQGKEAGTVQLSVWFDPNALPDDSDEDDELEDKRVRARVAWRERM